MISGIPTVVKTNILIRSMGPVSELVSFFACAKYFILDLTKYSFDYACRIWYVNIDDVEEFQRFPLKLKICSVTDATIPNAFCKIVE